MPARVSTSLPQTHATTTKPWIESARWDLGFFFGGSVLALVVGALAVWHPPLVIGLWWAWLLLLDGPHLAATLWRTALDPDARRRWTPLNLQALLWLLPGVVALVLASTTGEYAIFDLFLLFATLWSVHHGIRQHFGVMSLYAWHAKTSALMRHIDRWFLHGWLWLTFVVFLMAHPMNRQILGIPAQLTNAIQSGAWALGALGVVSFLLYSATLWWRHRRGEGLMPALFVMLPVCGLQAVAYLWIGAHEPLMDSPRDPEHYFLALAAMSGIVHSIEYFGIVLSASRRRAAITHPNTTATTKRLLSNGWLAYGAWVGLSLVYFFILAARSTGPTFALFDPSTDKARFFLAIYWGIFFHHYYVDQKIWRPSQDPELRAELGLSAAKP